MGFDARWVGGAAAVVFAAGGCFLGGHSTPDPWFDDGGGALWDGGFFGGWGEGGILPDAGVGPSTSLILPQFGATTTAGSPPPPISGGTLLVTADGRFAVAADPDRDQVYGVDLSKHALAYTVALQAGDEPGRVAEDGSGRVHIALRGGGALVTLDEATGQQLARRAVCPAPRGVTWDASTDLVWVACATGELVALPSAGGAATQSFTLDRDLRDVIVANGSVSVSRFRSAQVLRLAGDGTVARRDALPAIVQFGAQVAWRTIAGPAGQVIVVHQGESNAAIPTHSTGAYGGCGSGPPIPPPSNIPIDAGADASAVACPPETLANFSTAGCDEQPGAVVGSITVLAPGGSVVANRIFPASLPVDVAISPDGSTLAVAAAGNALTPGLETIFTLTSCGEVVGSTHLGAAASQQPIAVAFDQAGDLLVQTREPAALFTIDKGNTSSAATSIALSSASRADTGHEIFHTQAGAMIACASCHPEGGDDGHVWNLDLNQRRTPSLRGTIAGTAPYHWLGDEATFATLADDVYTTRMNGAPLALDQKGALSHWVESIPAPPAPSWVDAAAAARGRTIFESSIVGCASCHSGDKLTNNQTLNVGTGAAFQVPPLVGVGWRAPLMHDGCAATLADRFGKCATPTHGDLSSLSAANISDLASYLETL